MCTWLILLFVVLLQNIQVNGRYLNWESRNGLNKILILSLSRYFLTLVRVVNLLLAFMHILFKYSGNFKLLSMVMPNSFTVLISHILCSPIWAHTCSYFLPEMKRLSLPEFIFMYLKTEVTRTQSTPNFPKKECFLPPPPPPPRTGAYQGVKNVRFSGNLACFVFLLPPFRNSPFCHITDDIRVLF